MDKYDGYANYETWTVCLWFDSRADYLRCRFEDLDILEVPNARKDYFYDEMPELPHSTYRDLMEAGLSRVNWFEVAAEVLRLEELI